MALQFSLLVERCPWPLMYIFLLLDSFCSKNTNVALVAQTVFLVFEFDGVLKVNWENPNVDMSANVWCKHICGRLAHM
jgi:hypothetical protein